MIIVSTTAGRNPRRNGVAIMVNNRVRNAVLGCNLKNNRMISVRFQGKPFNTTVTQVYAPSSNAEEADVERFCEEHYCIGTWNVRSMNQGKLEVVKQEMARLNIDILGINELKWTGMGEFNPDDHYTYYCGQESLIRNGVAIMVNKRV